MKKFFQWLCGKMGHTWMDEKEFAVCAGCRKCVHKRDLPPGDTVWSDL